MRAGCDPRVYALLELQHMTFRWPKNVFCSWDLPWIIKGMQHAFNDFVIDTCISYRILEDCTACREVHIINNFSLQAISAMISRSYNGMKEGLQMLGLPDSALALSSKSVLASSSWNQDCCCCPLSPQMPCTWLVKVCCIKQPTQSPTPKILWF